MVQFRKRKSDGQSFPVGNNKKISASNPSNEIGGIKIGKGIKFPESVDEMTESEQKKTLKILDDLDSMLKQGLNPEGKELQSELREKKLPPIKDNSGNILDSGNRLEDIKEAEVRKRIDDFVEDEDSFIEELNQSESPLESMGVTVEAGDFLKENDEIAFREALNNTADSRSEDFRSDIESEIDEEKSLKQSRYVPL